MIRPEAKAFLARYAQAIIGACLAVLMLYWTLSIPGVLRYLTGVLAFFGAALAIDGFRRGRHRRGGAEAEGVVEIDERRITFLTANWGGSLSINDLAKIEVGQRSEALFWRIRDIFGSVLLVPYTARGAEGLVDAFEALDGFDLGNVGRAIEKSGDHMTTVWTRSNSVPVDPLT